MTKEKNIIIKRSSHLLRSVSRKHPSKLSKPIFLQLPAANLIIQEHSYNICSCLLQNSWFLCKIHKEQQLEIVQSREVTVAENGQLPHQANDHMKYRPVPCNCLLNTCKFDVYQRSVSSVSDYISLLWMLPSIQWHHNRIKPTEIITIQVSKYQAPEGFKDSCSFSIWGPLYQKFLIFWKDLNCTKISNTMTVPYQ